MLEVQQLHGKAATIAWKSCNEFAQFVVDVRSRNNQRQVEANTKRYYKNKTKKQIRNFQKWVNYSATKKLGRISLKHDLKVSQVKR